MGAQGTRYRIVLVEDPGVVLPARYQRSRALQEYWIRLSDPMEVLMEALLRLNRRGEGKTAWAPALAENPLTFLLDAMSDAVVLRQESGEPVYANPAAWRLGLVEERPGDSLEVVELQSHRYERRCMAFSKKGETLLLEVMHRLED